MSAAAAPANSLGVPRDGPATEFEPDDAVRRLPPITSSDSDCAMAMEPGPDFGLVLVVGWPPNPRTLARSGYESFISAVRGCFDAADLVPPSSPSSSPGDDGPGPAVYTYPYRCLHVTAATLHSVHVGTDGEQHRDTLKSCWRGVVAGAATRNDWPREPLRLRVRSAQIGIRAGILLWEETTGGLDAMRRCISDETKARERELVSAGVDVATLAIPQIVHSTFLRFGRAPVSCGDDVQGRFRDSVTPRLHHFFPDVVTADSVKLVCETFPYMHIPDNDRHVFEEIQLGS